MELLFSLHPFPSPNLAPNSLSSVLASKRNTHLKHLILRDFSLLESEIPWDSGRIWSTLALYLFSLHVPLSFGGLSVVAYFVHQPVLDPQTELQALSLLAIQILELNAVLWLLRCVAKPQHKIFSFFQPKNQSKERNWLLASILGFGSLVLLVFFTSLVADQLVGPKDVNNPILKEILSSGSISKTACILVYCIITPLLEEIVYRGFLLTSLASKMKWYQAVAISSAVFSAAHFSVCKELCSNIIKSYFVGLPERQRDLLLGGFGESGLVIHECRSRLTLFEIDVHRGGDDTSDVDPAPSILNVSVSKEEVDRRGSIFVDPAEFSNVLRNVIISVKNSDVTQDVIVADKGNGS
ncbi:unnamed protein product [Camellia sinensis]